MKSLCLTVLVTGLFCSQAMAEVREVIDCPTKADSHLKVLWNPGNGGVSVYYGNYVGHTNTNEMAWNKEGNTQAEDTEIYYHNGDLWTTLSVTDYGDSKEVSIKQTKGDNNDIVFVDSCKAILSLSVDDSFLENMTYVDNH